MYRVQWYCSQERNVILWGQLLCSSSWEECPVLLCVYRTEVIIKLGLRLYLLLPFGRQSASFPGQASILFHSQTIPKSGNRVWCSEWHSHGGSYWKRMLQLLWDSSFLTFRRLQSVNYKAREGREVSRESWEQAVRQELFLYLIQLKLWLLMWCTITIKLSNSRVTLPCVARKFAQNIKPSFLHIQEGLGTRLALVACMVAHSTTMRMEAGNKTQK